RTPVRLDDRISAFHLYVIRLDDPTCRRAVFEEMRMAGIGVNVHYIPIYKQPYYRSLGFASDYCSNAEEYYASAITLPLYPDLTVREQGVVVSELRRALGR